MDDHSLESLREALKHSPGNIPLKLLLAESVYNLNRINEAEKEYLEVLALEDNVKAKLGLAKVYFKKENYSTCNVILEDLVKKTPDNMEILVLHAKALLRENLTAEAISVYQQVLRLNPSYKEDELDARLRSTAQGPASHPEDNEE